jgi:predicted Mrr-cat superfamily restriction endonuclease
MTAAKELEAAINQISDNVIAADAKTRLMPMWDRLEKAKDRIIAELRAARAPLGR